MKTAVSLPDDLFQELDARARRLRVSRSGLLAQAAREFLDKDRPPEDATDAWNRALARAGQPIEEPAAALFQKRTKRIVRNSWR